MGEIINRSIIVHYLSTYQFFKRDLLSPMPRCADSNLSEWDWVVM